MQEEIFIPVEDGQIPVVRFFSDSSSPQWIVLLIPAVFGIDEVTEKHAQNLIEAGATVYALDSFWRRYPGALNQSEHEVAIALERMADLTDKECDGDVKALADYIRESHAEVPVVSLGICFGGRASMLAATSGWVDGAAAWHGIRIGELNDQMSAYSGPASLHFGGVDPWVPPEECGAIEQALAGNSMAEVVVHSDCDHGFTHFGRAAFNDAAFEASWAGLLRLASHLKSCSQRSDPI